MTEEPLPLTPELLLQAYSVGIFPMGSEGSDEELYWVDPHERGIIPLDGLHVSRSLRRTIRRGGFDVRVNHDFRAMMRDCATREETWINDTILDLYTALHERGSAHSIEVWRGPERIGGLYGVSIGAAFFGESMVSHERDASKIALVWLVARLRAGGFRLLDTQFTTAHLASMGGIGISRATYHALLQNALPCPADFNTLDREADTGTVLDLCTAGS
jgi:leucyl/phenylalanyl-tRNA--protein transferase